MFDPIRFYNMEIADMLNEGYTFSPGEREDLFKIAQKISALYRVRNIDALQLIADNPNNPLCIMRTADESIIALHQQLWTLAKSERSYV